MGMTVNSALVVIAFMLGIIPVLLTARLKRRLGQFGRRSRGINDCPPAAVVLPCKGLDPGFSENILSLLEQDYPSLELLFVVAAEDDPAYPALQTLLAQSAAADKSGVKATLLVAGINLNRAQKLTNQLAAINHTSAEAQVLVFIDSDCRPDRGFVRRLVEPLTEPGVGATTGYRWYHPPKPTLGSMLRSTWNAGALPFLVDPTRVFAWGGAMAIRREIFERAGIADAWRHAVSDDMTLTVAVRRMGLEVRFVPQCIAVSYEASTLAETLEFTNRQSLISRVYFPPLWWGTAIGHATANLLMFYGLLSIGIWIRSDNVTFLIGAACALLFPLQLANAAWMVNSVRELLPVKMRHELDGLRWRYVLTAPLASIMTLINTFHSLMTRRMTWRGIQYELRSPTETIVLVDKRHD